MSTFSQVLEVAGYSDINILRDEERWQLWAASFSGPTREFEERFLLFGRDSSWNDVDAAGKWLALGNEGSDVTVLLRNSAQRLQAEIPRVRAIIGSKRVFTISSFLYKTFERTVFRWEDSPTEARDFGLDYFVEPTIRLPADIRESASVNHLVKWLRGESGSVSNVGVLLAPAGSGKSTLALEVYRRISRIQRADLIPLLVESEQWLSMAQQDSLSLTDIWRAAVNAQFPNVIIGPEQLEVCLSGGTICPIFDGLDELFTLFPSHFNPTDTLNELLNLFSEGRLLITSRSRFWNENIAPAVRAQILEHDLLPFTAEQRNQYIAKRFPKSQAKQEKAKLILERLGGKVVKRPRTAAELVQDDAVERLDTLPYVVMLASESADTDAPDIVEKYGHLLSSADPLEGLVLAMCDREKRRQRLRMESEDQLRILEILATEFTGRFEQSDLELAIGSQIDAIDDEEIKRFREHALFAENQKDHTLRFRFSFIFEYLVARVIRRWFAVGLVDVGVLPALGILNRQLGSLLDVTAELLQETTDDDWLEVAKMRRESIVHDRAALSGFLHLIVRLARDQAKGARRDAAMMLLEVLGNPATHEIRSINLSGNLHGLDFSGVVFRDCRFTDIEFTNCVFSDATQFKACSFDGRMQVDYCEGVGEVVISPDCILSPSARSCWQIAQQGRRRLPITEDQVRDAMTEVLRRFRRGPAGFVTRKQDGVLRGTRRIVSFGDQLLEALGTTGVLRTFTSHGNDMYGIGDTHAVRVFLDNGLTVGTVKTALDLLLRKLQD